MTDPQTTQQTAEAIALGVLGGAAVLLIIGWLVALAGRRPFPASIVMSLTILAALALVGYAVGGEARPELAAIAGTAVGALAGATTSLLAREQHGPNDHGST